MATIPLEWKLSIQGSQEIKTKLNEIKSAFDRNEISATEYAKGLREVNRDSRTFATIQNTNRNIMLATNPSLNALTRATATFASASRSALSIVNAVNLARIASRGISSEQLETEANIARVMRDLNRETNPEKIAELNEELGILNAKLRELKDHNFFSGLSEMLILFSSVSIGVDSFLKIITKLGLTALPAWMTSASGLLGLVALPAAIASVGALITEFLKNNVDWYREMYEANNAKLNQFFLNDIPIALGIAGEYLANFFLNDLPLWATTAFEFLTVAFTTGWNGIVKLTEIAVNSILSGVEGMANGFVKAINKLISAYNSIARKIHLPTITLLSGVSLPRITLPTIAAANGFEGQVNSPTLFLAGEAGSEQVSITPNGKSGSGQTNIHITVQGSLLTTRGLVDEVDQALKDRLKRRGFTGF